MFTKYPSSLLWPSESLDSGAPTQNASVIFGRTHALDDIQDEAAELLNEAFFSAEANSAGPIGRHRSTNTLERFSLGVLDESERESVENHILACDFCTGKLQKADGVIAFLKAVLNSDPATTSAAVCH